MLAVVYCRVSTPKNSNKLSIASQEFVCKKYCSNNNITVGKIFSETCSGREMSKMRELNNAINYINSNNNITHLIIADASRLMRNNYQAINLVTDLNLKNVTIYSVSESIEYSKTANFMDKYKFRKSLNEAEYESDLISYRVNRSVTHRRSIGSYIGKPSYGYQCYKNNKGIRKIRPNQQEQEVLLAIKDKIKNKMSFSQIATFLTNSGTTFRGEPWNASRVRYVHNIKSHIIDSEMESDDDVGNHINTETIIAGQNKRNIVEVEIDIIDNVPTKKIRKE